MEAPQKQNSVMLSMFKYPWLLEDKFIVPYLEKKPQPSRNNDTNIKCFLFFEDLFLKSTVTFSSY